MSVTSLTAARSVSSANDNASALPHAVDPDQQARRQASAGPVVLESGIIEWYLFAARQLADIAGSISQASGESLRTMEIDPIRKSIANFKSYGESITDQGYIDRRRPEAGEALFLEGDVAPLVARLDFLVSLVRSTGTNMLREVGDLGLDADASVKLSVVSRIRDNAGFLKILAKALTDTMEGRTGDSEEHRSLSHTLHDLMMQRAMHALS